MSSRPVQIGLEHFALGHLELAVRLRYDRDLYGIRHRPRVWTRGKA
ncbi:hypothetical protein [Halorubrum laminariae]|uniref:Uncharacterized protein n=1 Tax=Halorubrum laminariae TaxID=1433523 RepID=A0ABD6C1B1_9EURY|nr:hypothetical protein [Halorubrum laminariae]